MRQFVDLHLRVPLEDMVKIEKMVNEASDLGYKYLGIPFPPNAKQEKIKQIAKICGEANIEFVSRTNLYTSNCRELLRELRRYRRKFEIIAVRCNTKEVARQAAKDRRVDLLQFSVTNLRERYFDEQEAELASQSFSAFEIELAPLLKLTSFSRIRLLSRLRKEIVIAQKTKVPIILSSGATNEILLRRPYDYAVLTTLFDLPFSYALKGISEIPLAIIKRNKQKLSPNYVAPGIRVVGRKICD
jgi:RNase P/RNase MRP subunit p30